MTAAWTSRLLSRRPVLGGLAAVLGIALVGGVALELPRFLRRRYPPTPYDDLLDQLADRESASRLGRTVLAKDPRFDPGAVASRLRLHFGGRPLAQAMGQDIEAGQIVEIQGWILPETLADICGLAAKTV